MSEHRLDSVAQNRTLGQVAQLQPTGTTSGQVNTDELSRKAAEIDQWLQSQKKKPSEVKDIPSKKKTLTGFGSEQQQIKELEKEGL